MPFPDPNLNNTHEVDGKTWTHDGEKWRSNPQYLGGMKVDDIAFLKAALVIARSKPTVKAEAKASTQSSFVEYLEDTEQQQSDIYQQPAVER